MAKRIQIAATSRSVVISGVRALYAGDTATITDAQYALIPDSMKGSSVLLLGDQPDPGLPAGVVTEKTSIFDSFTGKPDGPIDGAKTDSGHTWRSVDPNAGGGGVLRSGRLGGPASVSGNGTFSYNLLDAGQKMRSMSAHFVFSAGTGQAGIALINTANGNGQPTAGDNWLHLSMGPDLATLTYVTNTSGIQLFPLAQGAYREPMAKDGTTVYGATLEVLGNRITFSVWCETTGAHLLTMTAVDPVVGQFNGRYGIWEPSKGALGYDSVEILDVAASVRQSSLVDTEQTLAEIVRNLEGRLSDPLGLGVCTTLPEWAPSANQAVAGASAAANQAVAVKLLAAGPNNAQNVRLVVGASSGTISVGVYRADVNGALTRLATTGQVACPATGAATIPLTSPVTARRGDYVMLSASSPSATFLGSPATPGLSGSGKGWGFLVSAHPVPAGPVGPAAWYTSGPTPLINLEA